MLLLVGLLIGACENDDDFEESIPFELLQTTYHLDVGASIAVVLGENADAFNLIYHYNETYVTVENHIIYAHKAGVSEITLKDDEERFSYTLTVHIKEPITFYIYGHTQLYIYQESTYYLMNDQGLVDTEVVWSTPTPHLIDVKADGSLTPKARGTATLIATCEKTDVVTSLTITIIPLNPETFAFDIDETVLYTQQSYPIDCFFYPDGAYETVVWSSSDDDIAYVDETTSLVTKDQTGQVIITGRLLSNDEIVYQKAWIIEEKPDPMALILSTFVEDVFNASLTVYGFQGTYQTHVLGNVSLYTFQPLHIQERLIPLEHNNRQGSTTIPRYVVIHDTGNIASTANEFAHSNYVRNPSTGVSWHYSVGDLAIFRHVPDNEHAYHSGDGGRVYNLTNTGVRIVRGIEPNLTIDALGYYAINGTRTTVKAPLIHGNIASTDDIVDSGIRLVKGLDGYYHIGNTYYSGMKISNTGGDRGGIGIEKMIHMGVNLHETWAKTAKLTAHLLIQHNLTLDDVVTHEFFSGKNCPQTLRNNDQWDYFMQLVEAEYNVQRHLDAFEITFYSHNTRYINHSGRVVRLPNDVKTVEVSIIIEGDDYYAEETLEIVLPNE